MQIEKYYLGYQLGDEPAVALVRVLGSQQAPRVHWASARSRVRADIPYDAVLECLARLGSSPSGPMSAAAVQPEGEQARQALERCAHMTSPELYDPTLALGACAGFLGGPQPSAVVVADAGLLIGALDEHGLRPDLHLAAPEGQELPAQAPAAGRGPWPLVQELREAKLELLCAPEGSEPVPASRLAVAAPSTQQGLKLGYPELVQQLRTLRAAGDVQGLAAAWQQVAAIVARDLAVLVNTARRQHPGAAIRTIGRWASPEATNTLSFPEQLALGAAVLRAWAEQGTSLGEVCEAPPRPPAASAGTPAVPPARIESFAELFPCPARRETFLERLWGRASVHWRGAIDPHALFSGDEFLAAIQRAHERNPGATLLSEGASVVTVVENGRLLSPLGELPPYPWQWGSSAGVRWQDAHDVLAATERVGCPPWTASIRLASAHHVCPRLTPVVLSFFEFFASHCWVNAYYSPAQGVRGLACHADGTDVFVFQIEGEKSWVFDSAPLPSAEVRGPYLERVRAGQAQLDRECVLRPGDFLYLPAGTCHAALATTSPSLHLTFAVRRHTALRIRKWWAGRSGAPEELNQSVQRYDTGERRIRINEAVAREYLGQRSGGVATPELLEAYISESLRSDREATLLGRLLPNIDHL